MKREKTDRGKGQGSISRLLFPFPAPCSQEAALTAACRECCIVGVTALNARVQCPAAAPHGDCLNEQDFTTTTTTTPTTTSLYSDYDIYYGDMDYNIYPSFISDPPFMSTTRHRSHRLGYIYTVSQKNCTVLFCNRPNFVQPSSILVILAHMFFNKFVTKLYQNRQSLLNSIFIMPL